MDKKKILSDLIGYLVRKEFTVYEVLDAYYEESERHFFEDELPEETIPSEEQNSFGDDDERDLTPEEIDQAIADANKIFENKALQINAEKQPEETIETPTETKVTEPETKVT